MGAALRRSAPPVEAVDFGRTESSAPADGPEVREAENKKHRSHEKISGEAVFYVDKAGASMVQ